MLSERKRGRMERNAAEVFLSCGRAVVIAVTASAFIHRGCSELMEGKGLGGGRGASVQGSMG
jgi:hypothetical protein